METNMESNAARIMSDTSKILAYIVTLGFFGILFWVMVYGLPSGSKDVAIVLLGSLSTAWATIMAYYFGSTKGSADKTAVMAATINSGK